MKHDRHSMSHPLGTILVAAAALCWIAGCEESRPAVSDGSAPADAAVRDSGATGDVGPGSEASTGNDAGTPAPDGPAGPTRWELIPGPAPVGEGLTATLLPDGRVLVVGGYWESGPDDIYEDKAYLFDPDTRAFTSAGQLATGRSDHSATLLADGRVLVVGGYDATDYPMEKVEIYDPATNSWSAGPPMASARAYHRAVRLQNDEVLVLGGYASGEGYLDSIAIYAPASGSWKFPVTAMNEKRSNPGAVLLASGKVLILGGVSGFDSSGYTVRSQTLEIYDPQNGSFSLVGETLSYGKSGPSVNLLSDSRVLIVGGYGFDANKKDEIYNPVTNSVIQLTHPGGPPAYHAAAKLLDGRVLITGGDDTPSTVLAFDTAGGGAWSQLPPLQLERYQHRAVTLQDGTVLVVGGRKNSDAYVNVAEQFFP